MGALEQISEKVDPLHASGPTAFALEIDRLESEQREARAYLECYAAKSRSSEEPEYLEMLKAAEMELRLTAIAVEMENLERNRRKEKFFVLDASRMAETAKAPEFLVDGMLERDSHGIMGGASMTFKSFLALRMAYSICTGTEFMGRKVYSTGRVVYLCGEGEGGISRRIKALEQELGPLPRNVLQVIPGKIRIDDPADMADLAAYLRDARSVLVIFDTFASLCGSTDENSPSEVGPALRRIRETCRAGGASSIVVHHFGKDFERGFRGASNFTSDVDFAFKISREAGTLAASIECHKSKDSEPFTSVYAAMKRVKLSGLADQEGRPVYSLVAELGDACSPEPESATTGWARALHVLTSCYEGQRAALELGGHPNAMPTVTWRDWCEAMSAAGITNHSRERDKLRRRQLIEELSGNEYRPKR